MPTRGPGIRTAVPAWEDEAMALDDIPSRFVLDVVREMSPGLVPSWNVGLERWFKEHENTTVDEYAASFLREHTLTLFGKAPVARWAEFYRG